jgi:hypothetical protein
MKTLSHSKAASFISLFASGSTLICCALPALLVGLGAGAALSTVIGAFPQLVWLSVHKVGIYIFATCMLTLAGIMQWRARFAPCPTDPELAKTCQRTRRSSLIIYLISVVIYLIGGFFAFILPLLSS